MIEREIKLLFASVELARGAVVQAGASPLRPRRLQDDALYDTDTQSLGRSGCALRIRTERRSAGLAADRVLVTFKGPVQPAVVKMREEHETAVDDGDALVRVFEAIGLRVWFRYQKYREEFSAPDAIVAVDETPIGAYVEVEGSESGISSFARALGRAPEDYILGSYRSLFLERRGRFGIKGHHMTFADSSASSTPSHPRSPAEERR